MLEPTTVAIAITPESRSSKAVLAVVLLMSWTLDLQYEPKRKEVQEKSGGISNSEDSHTHTFSSTR
jgi:predicted solute-binding protein